MRIFLYSKVTPIFSALSRGIAALGHTAVYRNPAPFTEGQVEDADFVFTTPTQQGGLVQVCYERIGVHALFVHPPITLPGYYRIGDIPSDNRPDDRARAIGLMAAPRKAKGAILTYGRPIHPGAYTNDIDAWYERMEAKFEGEEVIRRPHEAVLDGQPSIEKDLEEARTLITFDSPIAFVAVRKGVDVICSSAAPYAEAIQCEPQQFMNRLASILWSIEDAGRADTIATILDPFDVKERPKAGATAPSKTGPGDSPPSSPGDTGAEPLMGMESAIIEPLPEGFSI